MASSSSKPVLPTTAKPRFGNNFDPWNSSSSGHQRPETQPGAGTGWRESRNKKLISQFKAGSSGGDRLSDTWGAGSEDWDDEKNARVPNILKQRAATSVADMLTRPGVMKESLPPMHTSVDIHQRRSSEELLMESRKQEDEEREVNKLSRAIFDGLVIYVNGSTYPLVSDHKLKLMLSKNGAQMSLHLGRRKVTHIIVGRPAGSSYGVGGALAGGKLEKEIKKIGGAGIKFVDVEWVLESIKAGKRLPEAQFSNTKIAPKAQGSVYGLSSKRRDGPGPTDTGKRK